MIAGVTVRATIDDFDGRPVQLTEERWDHIVERHPEILMLEETVLQAVPICPAGSRTRSGSTCGPSGLVIG
jgi:hypothetical protein